MGAELFSLASLVPPHFWHRQLQTKVPHYCLTLLESRLFKQYFLQRSICLGDTRHFRQFPGFEEQNPLFFAGRMQYQTSSPIFVKTTCFRHRTKTPLSKTTVSTTLIESPVLAGCCSTHHDCKIASVQPLTAAMHAFLTPHLGPPNDPPLKNSESLWQEYHSWTFVLPREVISEKKPLKTLRQKGGSKRVVLAFFSRTSKRSFPAVVLPWQKKAMIFDIPGPQEPERGYHSFRNHYIWIQKPVKHVTVIAENAGEFLRGIVSCNCILLVKQGNCNCNAN